MKASLRYSIVAIIVFLFNACKRDNISTKLIADFEVSYGKLGVVWFSNKTQNANYYKLDYGDGQPIKADSISKFGTRSGLLGGNYYKKNGDYIVKLTVYNTFGESNSVSQTITITNLPPEPIVDFSYEILENGKIKLKNLSKNAKYFQWSVPTFAEYYVVNKSDTSQTTYKFEFNGNYKVSLKAFGEVASNSTTKTINISNANKIEKASFIGTIDGNKVEWIEDGVDILNPEETLNGESATIISTLFFPKQSEGILIITRPAYIEENISKADKFISLQQIFTKEKDPRIIETKVVDVEPFSVNVYSKALWVTFKINQKTYKGSIVDGIIKIRYLIWDFRN